VPLRSERALHVLETELAHPKPTVRNECILFRVRSRVPDVDVKLAKADAFYLLERRRGGLVWLEMGRRGGGWGGVPRGGVVGLEGAEAISWTLLR
jgi:hypothetical protein